jgi:vancomycin permeability regulator SanA
VSKRQRRVAYTAVFAVMILAPWAWFHIRSPGRTSSVSGVAKRDVAVVLGAGITSDRRPTRVLADRLDVGVELYKRGKVRKLIMSGDNSVRQYDEVTAMKNYVVARGVTDDDVLLDYAGFRTLDSCVRLRKVFGQDRAIIVTQQFHLPRALHLCRWAGVDAIGVAAVDSRGAGRRVQSTVREVPASWQAALETWVFRRSAKVLGPAIDIDNPPADALTQPLD